ncbi:MULTISPECIES: carboxy-S-adenosyl-L-methionine synthase CmoA [unclassified Thalassotalea]|uniref:carboxy-S-adenosyl-L-methionine synthase CmoA n=1 Tax=unclassified Thalassotalea TaxID=2614972 RepID=UPI001080457A|nr:MULTISPECIES: carboxy-S-adenosyl-L-methionine synthase CmoA [unclassified Thalassotalea]NMP16770.1 carboxy-S-adenosyl-L-methionine synthase CmoA [Thalassotalea sp. Y01]QBY05568.1 carboxy-S-adenosyl-L-methionine synthase CmoA [Thalassotalea sp. HSM 43]
MTDKQTDIIYSKPQAKVGDFRFDAQVVEVFPDMIKRSVPGYSNIIETIGQLSKRYAQSNSNIYDLGCSLGAASLVMRQNIDANNCKIIAIDSSKDMVQRCQMHVNAFKAATPCEVHEGDILEFPMENASVVVLNFTLQFIEQDKRQQLMDKIAESLLPGGILILSEKIYDGDETCRELLNDLHHDFKRANGYSDLEIAQKRAAIENVMRPDVLETHYQRLRQAGFSHATSWFQCFNFFSLIAIK